MIDYEWKNDENTTFRVFVYTECIWNEFQSLVGYILCWVKNGETFFRFFLYLQYYGLKLFSC